MNAKAAIVRSCMRIGLGFVFLACFLVEGETGSAQAKRQTIELGSVQLYLGEPKAEAVTQLVTAGYRTTPIGNDKERFIVCWERTPKDCRALGVISFTSGALTFIKESE